ncbi:uncharacterized protein TrAtP1_007738 [Trichoderma atroviride]|uniref:uncharacterized protein n=1 Tax=Hypocrea atroviridis TaxID=63577 RepID=UPI003323F8CD|nr:hypothetical protein TrAtP1_007738 [Trichoderma atroviride]
MLLLNTKSQDLEVFATNEEVRYAILSHTWGSEEVTLALFLAKDKRTDSKGWDKIRRSCEVAARLGFDYIWIDTCCIDKKSSSELSEAINSMFQWYEKAGVCIAYLEDVSSADDPTKDGSQFAKCRWFSRGWTLQELIAPPRATLLFSRVGAHRHSNVSPGSHHESVLDPSRDSSHQWPGAEPG